MYKSDNFQRLFLWLGAERNRLKLNLCLNKAIKSIFHKEANQMSDNSRVINAEPTKDLFIYMLVRDIPLIRAIIDLVDKQ